MALRGGITIATIGLVPLLAVKTGLGGAITVMIAARTYPARLQVLVALAWLESQFVLLALVEFECQANF